MLVGFGDQRASETCQGSCWLILHSLMEVNGWICSPCGSYMCQAESLGGLCLWLTPGILHLTPLPPWSPLWSPPWARLAASRSVPQGSVSAQEAPRTHPPKNNTVTKAAAPIMEPSPSPSDIFLGYFSGIFF